MLSAISSSCSKRKNTPQFHVKLEGVLDQFGVDVGAYVNSNIRMVGLQKPLPSKNASRFQAPWTLWIEIEDNWPEQVTAAKVLCPLSQSGTNMSISLCVNRKKHIRLAKCKKSSHSNLLRLSDVAKKTEMFPSHRNFQRNPRIAFHWFPEGHKRTSAVKTRISAVRTRTSTVKTLQANKRQSKAIDREGPAFKIKSLKTAQIATKSYKICRNANTTHISPKHRARFASEKNDSQFATVPLYSKIITQNLRAGNEVSSAQGLRYRKQAD